MVRRLEKDLTKIILDHNFEFLLKRNLILPIKMFKNQKKLI